MSQKSFKLNSFLSLELLFVLLWNSGFIGAEYGLPYAGPWTFLFWRYLLLSLGLGLWIVFKKNITRMPLLEFFKEAILGVLAHGVWLACVLISLDLGVPGGVVALITALQPLLTGALSGPVLNEPNGYKAWIGLVLGFLGVTIVVSLRINEGSSEASLWGYIIPFGSVLGITIASLLKRYWGKKNPQKVLPMPVSLLVQSVATSLFVLLPAWGVEGLATTWSLPFVGTLFWLSGIVSFGAYWSLWKLYDREEATEVASLFYLSPPVTMFMAWLAFGDPIISTDLIGLVVAAAGALLVFSESQHGDKKTKTVKVHSPQA